MAVVFLASCGRGSEKTYGTYAKQPTSACLKARPNLRVSDVPVPRNLSEQFFYWGPSLALTFPSGQSAIVVFKRTALDAQETAIEMRNAHFHDPGPVLQSVFGNVAVAWLEKPSDDQKEVIELCLRGKRRDTSGSASDR